MKSLVLAVDGGKYYLVQGMRWVARKQPFTESDVLAMVVIILLAASLTRV